MIFWEKTMRRLSFCLIILFLLIIAGCGRPVEEKWGDIQRLLDIGRLSEAGQEIEEIAAADSLSAVAFYGRALLDEYHGYVWDAYISCFEAVKLDNEFVPALKKYIRLGIELGSLDAARKAADILISQCEQDPDGYLYLAEIDMLENQLNSAHAAIDKAASFTDDDLTIGLYKAELDFRSYDSTAIRKALDRLSGTEFTKADHFSRLAQLFAYLNMGDSAAFYVKKALELDKGNIRLKLQLARYMYNDRFLKEAWDISEKLVAEAGQFGPAYILAAYIKGVIDKPYDGLEYISNFINFKKPSAIGIEAQADYFFLYQDKYLAIMEYDKTYSSAVNLGYPAEYLRPLCYKVQNCCLEKNDIDLARELLKENYRLDPEGLEIDFIKAELMLKFPEVRDSARILVDDRLAENSGNPAWLELAARYYSRTRRIEKAVEIYHLLLDLPYPKQEYFAGLLELYKREKNTRATDSLAAILPWRFELSRELAERFYDIYNASGQNEKAVFYAERLYRKSPGCLPYMMTLAELYAGQDRYEDGLALIDLYVQTYPDDPEAHYRLGGYALDNGRYESVLQCSERSLSIDSAYGSAYELKGLYFQKKGNVDSAVYYFRRTVMLNWPTPLSYYYLGEYLLRQKDSLDHAAGLGMAAVRYFDRDPRGYHLLGRVYLTQEKYKLARSQFFKGLKFAPEDAELNFLLGKTCVTLGRKAEAKKHINKALKNKLPSPQREEAKKLLRRL